MNRQAGFSFMEVLLSLMLMTITAISLLEQQWHSARTWNQLQIQLGALLILDNASEQWMSHRQPLMKDDKRYDLRLQVKKDKIHFDLHCLEQGSSSTSKDCHYSRWLPKVV